MQKISKSNLWSEKSELVRDTARECVEEIGKYFIENDLGRVVGKSFLYNCTSLVVTAPPSAVVMFLTGW